jgi:hypothetical protein
MNEKVINIYQKMDIPTPLNRYTKKLTEDPHHGLLIIIHVIPTKINVLCLYSLYFNAIFKPIIIEKITKRRLNKPFIRILVSIAIFPYT